MVNMHHQHGASRLGVMTPVVLMVLAVFAILGVTFIFTGSSEYSQSALALYRLKAQLLAQAALEEAQAVVYNKVNRLPTGTVGNSDYKKAEWKDSLFRAVESAVESDSSKATGSVKIRGGREWIELLTEPGVSLKAPLLAADLGYGAELLKCEMRFFGFRKLPYPAENKVYQKETYYKNQLMDGDPDAKAIVPNDYIGYYTIRASARVRGQVRTLQATHDLKIVNVQPIAREFALFQMVDVKEPDHTENDLNKGGAFHVIPHGWGRLYMRGPYVVETEGYPDGEGGIGPGEVNDRNRLVSNSHIPVPADNQLPINCSWVGWQPIPNPRAGRLLPKFVAFDGPPQTRPLKQASSFFGTLTNLTMRNGLAGLIGSGWTAVGFDPARFIESGAFWYTGFKATDDKRSFCLYGIPRLQPNNFTTTFRGILLRFAAEGDTKKDEKPFWPHETPSGDAIFSTGRDVEDRPVGQQVGMSIWNPDPNKPDEYDDRWILVPEANLKAKFKVVKFDFDLIRLPPAYTTSPVGSGTAEHIYGLHWEGKRSPGWWDKVKSAFSSVAGAVIGWTAPLVWVGRNLFFAPTAPAALDPGQEASANSMPTNFKSFSRAATRVYSEAAKIRSITMAKADASKAPPLVLDGVIWSRKLNIDTPFKYAGKGVLGGEPPSGTTAGEGQVTGPIVPVRGRREEIDAAGFYSEVGKDPIYTDNYINIIYQGGSGNELRGEQMLKVKSSTTGSLGSPTVDGTVFSTHGVKPEGTVFIEGNYVCGVLNKQKSPDDSVFVVHYDFPVLYKPKAWMPGEADAGKLKSRWYDGDWHQCAVSPRIAHYYDKEQ